MTKIETAIRLFDGPAPGHGAWGDGVYERRQYFSDLFGTEAVVNVVDPTVTPVVPDTPNGTAIVVAPGGGYHGLSIESEGFGVARWLAERGVTAYVLEYRLVPGDDPIRDMVDMVNAGRIDDFYATMDRAGAIALADAQAAVRFARSSAGVDRVGFIGFSAGGNLGVRVALADAADARPDFNAWVYPAARGLDVEVPDGSGPLFLIVANDDELGLAPDSFALHQAWTLAGRPVELHAYERGGHGFGMRQQALPSDAWIERLGDWLAMHRFI